MTPSSNLSLATNSEAAAAAEDFHPSALPTRLTLKSSASTFADANQSPYHDDLLTPPLTNPSLDEPPFRPAESDRISLNMKRHHGDLQQKRRRHNRACVSSGDVDQTTLLHESPRRILSRCRSAPVLTNLLQTAVDGDKSCKQAKLCFDAKRTHKADPASRRDSLPNHPRRWTISGKAAPTHVLTSMSPSALLPEQDRPSDDGEDAGDTAIVETPAMITLQRAASSKSRRTSLRPEAYTSFPTPTFRKTRSGFVTNLFGDGWRRSDNTLVCTSVESVSVISQSHCPPPRSARASVDQGNVRPSQSTVAHPVCTDVAFDPFIQTQMATPQPAIRARRCSTKYVSGGSTVEIIWDENVSTSSSSGSRRTSAEQTRRISMRDNEVVLTRRPSVAVDKLETQLSKGIQQCRRISSASKSRGAGKNATRRDTYHNSFHNMLNFQEAGDAEEPDRSMRSRASTTSKQKCPSPEIEVHLTTVTGDATSTQHMGFFPPLSPNATNSQAQNDPLLVNPWRTSWEIGNDTVTPLPARHQRKGSMIGQSTGVRKKSVYEKPIRKSRKAGITKKTRSKVVEDDRRPLLGHFHNWSDEASAGSFHH